MWPRPSAISLRSSRIRATTPPPSPSSERLCHAAQSPGRQSSGRHQPEQSRSAYVRIWRPRTGRRWPEDGMPKCGSYSYASPKARRGPRPVPLGRAARSLSAGQQVPADLARAQRRGGDPPPPQGGRMVAPTGPPCSVLGSHSRSPRRSRKTCHECVDSRNRGTLGLGKTSSRARGVSR